MNGSFRTGVTQTSTTACACSPHLSYTQREGPRGEREAWLRLGVSMVAGVSGVRSVGTGDTLCRAGMCALAYLVTRGVLDRGALPLSIGVWSHVGGALAVGVDDVPPRRVLHLLRVCIYS